MNGRKRKPAAAAAVEDLDLEDPPPDEGDDVDALPWEDEFDLWQQEETADETALSIILYRMRPGKVKERVWKWVDEIPDEHQIGLQFGGGDYMVYGTLSGPGVRKVKHRRFRLAASYDAARAAAGNPAGGMLPSAPSGFSLGMAGAGNPFDLVKSIIQDLVVPLMAVQGRAAGQAGGNPLAPWEAASAMMGRVVEQGAQSQIRMAREVSMLLAGGGAAGGNADDDATPENEFKEFLKGVIQEYGPPLLEASGLKLKSMLGMIKRDDVFRTLINDQPLYQRVLSKLLEDPGVDQATVRKVLDKLAQLKVGIPMTPRPAAAAPSAAAPPA